MKTKSTTFNQNSLIRIIGIPSFILMIPLIGMQISSEWDWDAADFIIIGILLVGAALLYEVVSKKAGKYKLALGGAIIIGVAYVWAELAVGIFTNLGS